MDAVAEKLNVAQYSFQLSGLGSDNGQSIKGTMLNPLNFSGSNSFTTSGEMVRAGAGGIAGFGDKLGAGVRDVLNNKIAGRQAGGYGKFNKSETRSKWTESSRPSVTCEFTLLANTAQDAATNVKLIQLLKSATLPRDASGALLAPLGYRGGVTGTLTFALGTWLVMPKLIMTAEQSTPSLQIMSNGFPLFWHCQFTIEPFESITIADFQRYFQQPAVLNPSQPASTNAGPASSIINQLGLPPGITSGIQKLFG